MIVSQENAYADFLASKDPAAPEVGFEVAPEDLHPALFPWQQDLVRWALKRGRAALFERVGLGKTFQQLDWARLVHEETGGDVLILAPLAVGYQTARIAREDLDMEVAVCRDAGDVQPSINITNYELLDRFDPADFAGVVLDESSRLKGFGSRTRWALNAAFAKTPYKLCCTATPAPNQHSEIGTHAHFLGVMDHGEMLTRWFINDTTEARQLRLKKHGEKDFWRWVATWAACVMRPSDLLDEQGRPYPDDGFDLPPLVVKEHRVAVDHRTTQEETGKLFRAASPIAATELYAELRRTTPERIARVVEIVNESHSLYLTTNSSKLAACLGSLSTTSDGEISTTRTPKSEQSDSLRAAAPKRTKSTCASTTRLTKNDGSNTGELTPKSETEGAGRGTQTTLNTGRSAKSNPGTEIRPRGETQGFGHSSGLTPQPTIPCSKSKAEDARSAMPRSGTAKDGACMSITAMQGEAYEDCCARNATLGSANSGTTPSCSDALPATCRSADRLEPWIVWCNTNAEQRELERAFGDRAISVYGSLPPHEKERRLLAFANGERPILISKPKLAGFGLNYQHCARHVFVGLSFSFEQFHQALGRSHRFGQTRPVEAHVVTAETEQQVLETINRKREEHARMQEKLVAATRENARSDVERARVGAASGRVERGEGWELREGDCVEVLKETVPDDSVHLSIFSPPFSSLYAYSPSLRDMGNCADDEEFFEHFSHLIPELLRATVPGRLCVVHTKDLVRYKNRYGYGGLRDFTGEVTRAFEDCVEPDGTRWAYHSKVTIWTDPVREMQRTKRTALLYKTLKRDASYSAVGNPEYLVIFRKWTPEADSPEPVEHRPGTAEEIPLEVWQRYASPVWDDIRRTDVLNAKVAREDADEKHLAPLQLGVIRRCIELWSNPGDLVLDPFAGLGSTGYEALAMGRRFLGTELKGTYFDQAVKFLRAVEDGAAQETLFEAGRLGAAAQEVAT